MVQVDPRVEALAESFEDLDSLPAHLPRGGRTEGETHYTDRRTLQTYRTGWHHPSDARQFNAGSSDSMSYRPGWHNLPDARQ